MNGQRSDRFGMSVDIGHWTRDIDVTQFRDILADLAVGLDQDGIPSDSQPLGFKGLPAVLDFRDVDPANDRKTRDSLSDNGCIDGCTSFDRDPMPRAATT
jgi:hypothetical protein